MSRPSDFVSGLATNSSTDSLTSSASTSTSPSIALPASTSPRNVPNVSSSSSNTASTRPPRLFHDPPPVSPSINATQLLSPAHHPTPTTHTALSKPKPGEHPKVNLLVVGLVTDTTARFLLEINDTKQVEVRLNLVKQNARAVTGVPTQADDLELAEKHGTRVQQVPCVANRVSVVRFSDLLPNARYEIQLIGCVAKTSASITTHLTRRNPATCPMNIMAVSCNMIGQSKLLKKEDIDLWKEMAKRLKDGTLQCDLLLHLGDQVYADEPRDNREEKDAPYQLVWDVATEWLRNSLGEDEQNRSGWEKHREHITELYRELYRETWGWEGTDYVLANVSNLMTFDDHDFRDEWGQSPEDSDPTTINYFIGTCARRAQFEYQRQLHVDVDFSKMDEVKSDHHAHVFGETIGMFMADVRGPSAQYIVKDDPRPYLGTLQWNNIRRWLADDGLFTDCNHLIACFGTPLVYLPPKLNDFAGNTVIRDALGHFANERYKAEQIEMLNLLCQWKKAKPNREVLVLAGDVHVGGCTGIYREYNDVKTRDPPLLQFITSAICNYLLKNVEFVLGVGTQFLISRLDDDWRFKHRKFVRERNYGEIQIATDEVGPVIRVRHIIADSNQMECDWVDTRSGLGEESAWKTEEFGKTADEIGKEQVEKYKEMLQKNKTERGAAMAAGAGAGAAVPLQADKVVALKTVENVKSEDGRLNYSTAQ